MRCFLLNVNGIFTTPTKLQDVFVTAKSMQAGIIGLTETNTDWKKPHIRNKFTSMLSKLPKQSKHFEHWKSSKIEFSTSKIKTDTDAQRGGTSTTVIGRWVGRVSSAGKDEELGRWTWITMKGDTNLTIITMYRVCQDKGHSGEQTAHAQQHAILLNKMKHPDPRKQVLQDLREFITIRRHKGEAILLMTDANEEGTSNTSYLRKVMDQLSMTNLHHLLHGEQCPGTYQRGNDQIDHIYGCPVVAANTVQAGILPFKYGVDTDHRGLYVDIEVNNIFKSSTAELQRPQPRLLSSENSKLAGAVRKSINKSCKNQNIYNRLSSLTKVPPNRWTRRHQNTLNQIDTTFGEIVLKAERQECHKSYGYPQSAKLIQAGQTLRYWRMRQSQLLIPQKDISKVLRSLAEKLDISIGIHNEEYTINEVKEHISIARRNLTNIQKDARRHREEWLQERAMEAAQKNDTTTETALKNIISNENNKKIYKRIARDISATTRSSVYYIGVPADGKPPKQSQEWKEVRDSDQVYKHLLHHSEEHFKLAQNTPFGKSDRATNLGFTGTGLIAHSILEGNYSYKLHELHDEARQFILNLKRNQCPTMHTKITKSEVYKLYKKWDERTSTSPSNIHLGLYKTMIESPRLLSIMTMLMNLPLRHGQPLKRWTNSVMCMIEKDIGAPRIHRLRLIHLFEADMNGIAKIIWARRFIYHCQKYTLLHPSQHGGLPGTETQHVLLKFRMTIDSANIMRHNLAINNNDAEACYDRIIPAINGISHMSKGMPINAIKMQNNILLNMKYTVRTAHGVSKAYWTNREDDPKFGLGQGGGWSPAGFASLSTDMIKTHEQLAPRGMTIPSVTNSDNTTDRTIDSYVDDANNGLNDGNMQDDGLFTDLVQDLEISSQQWERILNVTGGSLNLLKCFCSFLTWRWKEQEYPQPATIQETPGEITIINSSTKTSSEIKRLEPTEAFKLLGVWVQLHGRMTTQYNQLQKKIAQLTRDICASHLSHNEAQIAYKRVAFKRIEYCLPMTTFSEEELNQLQKPFTTAFMANSGYHRGMPRTIVYAPERYGGIGMENLYQSRGILQLKYLIAHVRQQDDLGRAMICLLEQTQIFAGTSKFILMDTMDTSPRLQYVPRDWIMTIREFLKSFSGQVEFPAAWTPQPQRVHDECIMDIAHQWTTSPTKLLRINACRLYLRVLTVADITEATGKFVRGTIMTGNQHPCRSSLLWPRQCNPSAKSWSTWKSMLTNTLLVDRSNRYELMQWLGPWIQQPHLQYHSIIDPDTKDLYIETELQGTYDKYSIIPFTRAKYDIREGEHTGPPQRYIPAEIRIQAHRCTAEYSLFGQPITETRATTFQQHLRQQPQAIYQLLENVTTVSTAEEIAEKIRDGDNFRVASDGSKNNNGSTFGWVMETMDENTMAEGMGPVHGQIKFVTSHRAELYGVASVLSYLHQLTRYYHINQTTTTIEAYCDNRECVNKTNEATNILRGTKRHISPDYDIESVLRDVIQQAVFKVQIEWVKSHQDDNEDYENLTRDAQLNITADELAEFAYEECPTTTAKFPSFPSTKISLLINDCQVTSRMTRQIEDAIHIPKIQKYQCIKYGWTTQEWKLIDWDTVAIAKPNTPGLRRFLHRFKCEWLPVGARTKFYAHHGINQCISCNTGDEETCEHLFHCTNARRKSNLINQVLNLMQTLRKRHTYKKLLHIFQVNLLHWINNEPMEMFKLPENPNNYDHMLQRAVQDQEAIGWEHVFKGWIVSSWTQSQEMYYIHRSKTDHRIQRPYHSGVTWSKTIIQGLQEIAYSTWMRRNKDIYGHDEQEEKQNEANMVKATVRRAYAKRIYLPTNIQWRYFSKPITDRVTESIQSLQAWYNNLRTATAHLAENNLFAAGIG